MAHDAHATDHAHDSHGEHGHAADVADGPTSGPFGWPFAFLVGAGILAGSLYAIFAH